MSQIPKMPENWDAYNDRPAIQDKDKTELTKKLVERLREVAGGADTEFGEDSKLMLEAATALASLADELENERQKVAGCSTAAIGYWKEGDSLHPDYECAAIHDVARLYAKVASLADELRAHETVMRLLFERFPDCQALGDLPGWVDELKDELRLAQTELKGCYRIIDELKEELRLAREEHIALLRFIQKEHPVTREMWSALFPKKPSST